MNISKIIIASFVACVPSLVTAQSLPVYLDETQPIDLRVKDALSRMTLEEKCRLSYAQSKFSSPGVARLGIPELYMSDGPHGVRPEINWNDWHQANWTNDYCTAFPALTCLAATWNPRMALLYGKNIGEEARYRKKNVLLGPGVNIYRTPLNGRNFEYMGEDPLLAGTMAVPYIQGLQSNGIACCLKHFALNDQEVYRGHVDVKVSDRALYEIYLPAFKKAVEEGGAWSVMGSYNQYLNAHACNNRTLLHDILKRDWQFKGAVITDWGGCHTTTESALNGLDLEMGSYTNGLTSEANGFGYDDYYLGKAYLDMCRKGEIPDSVINDKASRMLRLILLTNTTKCFGSLNSEAHLAAAREIADEGVVLLKNNPVDNAPLLPLDTKKYHNILIVGENATKSLCLGGGSSELKPKDEVSPLRGLKERYGNAVNIDYAQGYASGEAHYGSIDNIAQQTQDSLYDDAIAKARHADLIIYIGGLNKNHFEDCEGGDRLSYNMSYNQDKLITDLLAVQPKMIVVIVSGNAVAMPWLAKTPALLQSWYLGSEAGHALADIISGDVNPSGKTIFSYANNLDDYPSQMMGHISYPGVTPDVMKQYTGLDEGQKPKSADILKMGARLPKLPTSLFGVNTSKTQKDHEGIGTETELYNEDILVGYRWFDTKRKPVMFPFGYGLSYTTFAYGKATASAKSISEGGAITFTIDVTNSGSVEGKEIVQLYIGDDKASVVRPAKELKAFSKISLKPGETKQVTLSISSDDLKFFDENAHKWVLEPGMFKAYIGSSSRDIKQVISFKAL